MKIALFFKCISSKLRQKHEKISSTTHSIRTAVFTSFTPILILLFSILISSCGPSIEMTRLVPSAYDISKAKRVAVQDFEDYNYKGSYHSREYKARILEDSLVRTLEKSRLFVIDQAAYDAIFTGTIYDFSVKSERYLEKREREENTANGTKKVEYTVPYLHKQANIDVEVSLQSHTGMSLGRKRYTAYKDFNFEEKDMLRYGNENIIESAIQQICQNFAKDLNPHSEKYNVNFEDNKDLQEGQSYLENQQWFEAKRFFENYLKNHPNDAEAYYHLGLAYELDRQYSSAASQIQKALNYCTKNCKTYEKALKRVQNHQQDSDKYHEQVDTRR